MERRKHKRIRKNMILKVNNKPGSLIDISRSGLRLSSVLTRTPRQVDIALKADNRIFNIHGDIQWMRNGNETARSTELGVRVLDPPREYRQFLDTLSWDSSARSDYGWVLVVLSIMLLIGVVFGILTLLDFVHF